MESMTAPSRARQQQSSGPPGRVVIAAAVVTALGSAWGTGSASGLKAERDACPVVSTQQFA